MKSAKGVKTNNRAKLMKITSVAKDANTKWQ